MTVEAARHSEGSGKLARAAEALSAGSRLHARSNWQAQVEAPSVKSTLEVEAELRSRAFRRSQRRRKKLAEASNPIAEHELRNTHYRDGESGVGSREF